ncbi:unnamed protein product [Lactuca virosa]|uniref:Uncharacterized protein n=1 Tax=Lactuca virosa TaxID=75947 RepID=A0AAU9PGW2_9ASTR|nr:unnamed protein product [Lactuca virosa]
MAENDDEDVYLRVHLHYNGIFVRHPSGYVGGNYFLFTDVDWASMDVRDFFPFLDRAIGEEFQNLYYCLPNIPLSRGIRHIVDDLDFAPFIDTGYEYGEISVYVDHNGNGLDEWWDDDMNLVVSEDNESGLEDDGVPRTEGNTAPDETYPNVGLEDEVIDIDKIPLNKTSGDEFLSILCPPEGDTGHNEVEEEDVEIHSIFNPDLQWNRQLRCGFCSPLVNSGAGGVHGSVNGGAGGVHGGEGGGVHGVRKKKVKAKGVGVAIRTRKPSERILKNKLAKVVYGKNGEGN